ncbi:MAG: ImuA family protein [Phycisphaerae bacterium]
MPLTAQLADLAADRVKLLLSAESCYVGDDGDGADRAVRRRRGAAPPPDDFAERVFDIRADLSAEVLTEKLDERAARPGLGRVSDQSGSALPSEDPLSPRAADVPTDLVTVEPSAGGGGERQRRIAQLVRQLDDIRSRWRPRDERFATGFAALDEALGGGLARAAIHELLAPRLGSAARFLALQAAARAALPARRKILLLDLENDFYPPAARRCGVPLDQLIVIRARRPAEVLWVSEQALRCRGVGAVIAPVREIDPYVSRRLQLAAESGGAVGLFIKVTRDGGNTFAASRLQVDSLPASMLVRRSLVTVLKLRDGQPGAMAQVEWPDVVLPYSTQRVDLRELPLRATA